MSKQRRAGLYSRCFLSAKRCVVGCLLVFSIGLGLVSCDNLTQANQAGSAENRWLVWLEHGNRKIWPEQKPDKMNIGQKQFIQITAAKNEWEPFQLAIHPRQDLRNLTVNLSTFKNAEGDELPPADIYWQHSVNIEATPNKHYGHTGLTPDALVPFIHPSTGEPTAGLYGVKNRILKAGLTQGLWFDLYVPSNAKAGDYTATLEITGGEASHLREHLDVSIKVHNFVLPLQNALKACFQLTPDAVRFSHRVKTPEAAARLTARYELMLHQHGIDNWSPTTGYNYGLNGVKIKVEDGELQIDWREFDKNVSAALNGSAFADGRPAQCLFVPYWMPVRSVSGRLGGQLSKQNYQALDKALFSQWVHKLQEHLRGMGWLDRAAVFYFDEPFLQHWKYEAFVEAAKVIRESAPDLKILLTDGYRGSDGFPLKQSMAEPIEPFVDIWDPVTFQVSTPERLEFYRARRAQGKQNMWCQTVGNANDTKPFLNLFLDYDMPFHRMWGVLSWDMGFNAIEWWETVIWYDEQKKQRLDVWTNPMGFPGFQQPVNGDGRLFYPGTLETIGGSDIPIGSIRLKAVREAIEDYQYLQLLDQAGKSDQFDMRKLHTTNTKDKNRQTQPMPTGRGDWRFWEGDPDAFMAARQEIARLLSAD